MLTMIRKSTALLLAAALVGGSHSSPGPGRFQHRH